MGTVRLTAGVRSIKTCEILGNPKLPPSEVSGTPTGIGFLPLFTCHVKICNCLGKPKLLFGKFSGNPDRERIFSMQKGYKKPGERSGFTRGQFGDVLGNDRGSFPKQSVPILERIRRKSQPARWGNGWGIQLGIGAELLAGLLVSIVRLPA